MINKPKLYTRKPKRFFAFGCSFTRYDWPTWADIIAKELGDIPSYNMGRPGCGNLYISNIISQADKAFNFTEDDLIIVCWTSVTREDRWRDNWYTPGNVYKNTKYGEDWVNTWCHPTHFLMRDLTAIDLVDSLLQLRGVQYHYLQMGETISQQNEYSGRRWFEDLISKYTNNKSTETILKNLYNNLINKFNPSFYKVLWKNDADYKHKLDLCNVHRFFKDGHPTVDDNFVYLTKIFEHNFSDETKKFVKEKHMKMVDLFNESFDTIVENGDNLPWQELFSEDKKQEIKRSLRTNLFKQTKGIIPE